MSSCKILYIEAGRAGWMAGSHWLVLTGCHVLTVCEHLTTLTACIWLNVHTVGPVRSCVTSAQC